MTGARNVVAELAQFGTRRFVQVAIVFGPPDVMRKNVVDRLATRLLNAISHTARAEVAFDTGADDARDSAYCNQADAL